MQNTLLERRMDRRACLRLMGGAAAGTCFFHLPGCSDYQAETGESFAAWDFPGSNAEPEIIAARAALLAASPHNTQPWALRVTAEAIELFADFDRNLGTMDSLRRELHIGLGCALENLTIAAHARGRATEVELLPEIERPNLVARVHLSAAAARDDALFDAIAKRHTNRGAYLDVQASSELVSSLSNLAAPEAPAVGLCLLTSPHDRARFREQTIAATQAIADDAQMSRDSEAWYRHSHAEIERFRDGTTLDATGAGALMRCVGKNIGRPSVSLANRYWVDATAGRQTTGSAFAIVHTAAASARADQLRAGRLYQRLQLWATSQGLAMQPLNQLAERQDREESHGLPPRFSAALQQLMAAGGRRAQMLFRIGHPVDTAFASPRRPLAWVLR